MRVIDKKGIDTVWLNCVPVAKSTKYLEEINHGKGIREKIKLVSSAGTGHFYTLRRTNVLSRKNWN